MRFTQAAQLQTASGQHPLLLHVARTTWSRFRGLMLHRPLLTSPSPQGLLITRCPSVHGFCMRFALDVVYLATDPDTQIPRYIVTHAAQLRPWRISFGRHWVRRTRSGSQHLRAAHALELPAGSIAGLGIAPGDLLELQP